MFITVLSLIVSVIFAFVFRQASSCVDLFRTNYQRLPFDVIEVIKLVFHNADLFSCSCDLCRCIKKTTKQPIMIL